MSLNSRYPGRSSSSPCESESDISSVEIPISSIYDPVTNYLTPRPKFLRYDPERPREILRRLKEAMDDFGSTSIGSNLEGSEDSVKQEEDSDSHGAGDEVETQSYSLRWLCELLLSLLILVLFMVSICNMSILCPPQNFEDWRKSLSCTYEGVSEKVEFVEIDVSSKSISSPSDEVGDIEERDGNLTLTCEEAPENIIELLERQRDATEADFDPWSGDIKDAAEWIEADEVMKSLLRENQGYDELDETAEVQDGGVWKRVEVEPEESYKAVETRVKKNDDVCEQENGGGKSNFYWIKKNSEPWGSGIAEPEVGSESENLQPEETREVGEVTLALAGIESVTSAVLYGSATAVLVFVLVLYSWRKKNLATDTSPTTRHSFRAPPIKCPREFAEKPGREDHLASDSVSSFPLEVSPTLGSFTTIEMISRKREDGTGEAWINIATPVRRSGRIRDRAIRSRRHLMSSS